LICSAGPSAAFKTREHEWISDRGFCVATKLVRAPSPGVQQAIEVVTKRSAICDATEVEATYGKLVAFADFSKRPEEAMNFSGRGVNRIDLCQMEDNRTVLFRTMGEVLVNEHHFGLSALRDFHSVPVRLAQYVTGCGTATS
jgi:hypothetical protein